MNPRSVFNLAAQKNEDQNVSQYNLDEENMVPNPKVKRIMKWGARSRPGIHGIQRAIKD